MKALGNIAMTLLIIGGINWGLIGFFGFDLVRALFGNMTVLSRIIYALVGLSALYELFVLAAVPQPTGTTRTVSGTR